MAGRFIQTWHSRWLEISSLELYYAIRLVNLEFNIDRDLACNLFCAGRERQKTRNVSGGSLDRAYWFSRTDFCAGVLESAVAL